MIVHTYLNHRKRTEPFILGVSLLRRHEKFRQKRSAGRRPLENALNACMTRCVLCELPGIPSEVRLLAGRHAVRGRQEEHAPAPDSASKREREASSHHSTQPHPSPIPTNQSLVSTPILRTPCLSTLPQETPWVSQVCTTWIAAPPDILSETT